jgi:Ca2+-binding RTX toxin-like protein
MTSLTITKTTKATISATNNPTLRLIGSAQAFFAITGGAGNDILVGRDGADLLTGHGGADTFRYDATSESAAGSADQILDFTPGTDKIDLSRIDADTATAGNQAFHLGATAGHAGDIVLAFDAGNNRTSVSLFVDGDAVADGVIWLTGDHTSLTGAHFVL